MNAIELLIIFFIPSDRKLLTVLIVLPQVTCYRMIPLRASSRAWGWLTNLQLPRVIRPWVYGLYADMFGCNLHEAQIEDLYSYPSLSDFFCRQLKDDARPIDPICSIVRRSFHSNLHAFPETSSSLFFL